MSCSRTQHSENLGCPELNIRATKWVFQAFVIGTSVVNGHLILQYANAILLDAGSPICLSQNPLEGVTY